MLDRQQNAFTNKEEMRRGKLILQSHPRIASIGLTLRCNLNCIMCFTQKMQKKDMTKRVFENVTQLFPTLEEVRWNDAGELFASRKCSEFLKTINTVKIPKSYLSTNFKAAGKYMEEILGGGFTHLSVSIDAAREKTYKSIRRGGNFRDLLKNLDRFRQLKEKRKLAYPQLTLVFVALKRNIEELPAFVDLAQRYNAVEIHVLKLLPNPAELEHKESVTLDELRPYYQEAFVKAQVSGIRLSHIAYTDFELLKQTGRTITDNETPDLAIADRRSQFEFGGYPFCHSPWTEMLIDVDGKVRPCCYHPKVLGDLTKDSILTIWNNDSYQKFRSKIVEHDFRECHHCPWLHKVFHYQVPEKGEGFHPLNRRLQTLEQGWDLKRDIVNRLNPFTDLKVELDPLAYRLNKEWDLGGVLPEAESLYGPSTDHDQTIREIEKQRVGWLKQNSELELDASPSIKQRLTRLVKQALVRILRFHTGVQFFHQRQTNLWFLEQIDILNKKNRDLVNYYGTIKKFVDNQKEFNALLVHYLNQFSERFFERIERQKDLNMEYINAIGQTNERIDHLTRDNSLMLELMNSLAQQLGDIQHTDTFLPHHLAEVFFSGMLAINSHPQEWVAGQNTEVHVEVRNMSLRHWTQSGPYQVGLDYIWLRQQYKERHPADHQPIWLPEPLLPMQKTILRLPISIPSVPGTYSLLISLLTGDGRWFFEFGKGSLEFSLEVIHDQK